MRVYKYAVFESTTNQSTKNNDQYFRLPINYRQSLKQRYL